MTVETTRGEAASGQKINNLPIVFSDTVAGYVTTFDRDKGIYTVRTPGGAEGFGWHYDVEDVFIVQTLGSKQYRLRKNTVNPWPLVETTPDESDYVECRLSDLPLITYSERDAAPYFTSAMFIAREPETGVGNLSFHRSMYVSDSELRCRLAPRHHLEDAPHHQHFRLVHLISVSSLVEPESEVRPGVGAHDLALHGLTELAYPCPFGNLSALHLGKLVEYTVHELALWAVVSAVVQGTYLRPVLLEFAP
jgi:hypothetical protein